MAQLYCVSCDKADAHFFVMAESRREANYFVYDAIMDDEEGKVSSFNRVKKHHKRLKNNRNSILHMLTAEPMMAVGSSSSSFGHVDVYDLWEDGEE